MIVTSILFYKKFCGDSEKIEFEFNPYDTCVANRIKVSKQHTVRFHVDDVMYINVNPKVNDKFREWMNHNYGKCVEVKANRGKLHKHLGMNFDFTEKGKVKIKTHKTLHPNISPSGHGCYDNLPNTRGGI